MFRIAQHVILPSTLPAVLLLSAWIPGQATRPAASDAVDAHIEAALDRAGRPGTPGAVLTILKAGRVQKSRGYGLANVELQVPMTADTRFTLASVTKVFTATLVLTLVQEGKLGLDDPIGDRLEDLPEAWRLVTVRQLLSHTSGLPDVVVDAAAGEWLGATRDEALRKAGKAPMAARPGSVWSYNQTNYVLLGLLIEELTGSRLEDAVATRLLQPLGLTSVTWGDARELVPGRASMYSRIDWTGAQPRLSPRTHPAWVTYPAWTRAAAGMNATAMDLARFAEAVGSGKVLEARWRDAMWTAATLADGKTFRMEGTLGVGLGWLVDDRLEGKAVGGTGGSAVAFRHVPGEQLTVVLLTNCLGVDPDGLVDGILGILRQAPAGR